MKAPVHMHGHDVTRLQCARSRGHLRLRLQRGGRRHRHVHAAVRRVAPAGPALQGREARDADERQPGQALPRRRGALQAVLGVQLRHRPHHRRADPRRHRAARGELSVHLSRPHRALPARRVLRRQPGQRQSGRRRRPRRRADAGRSRPRATRTPSAPTTRNRFVFVPHLGTDQVFQFLFDQKTGRLTANTPPVLQLKAGSGPRHSSSRPTTASSTC